jgi:hypothetical protein
MKLCLITARNIDKVTDNGGVGGGFFSVLISDLNFSPNIRVIWKVPVAACMRGKLNACKSMVEMSEASNHVEDLEVGEMIILKMILM